jgi:hypothetical protein
MCECRDIVWRPEAATGEDLRFEFTSISVSAIACDQTPCGESGEKCLYLQIDTAGDDDDDVEVEEDAGIESIGEVHIFFKEEEQLDRAFKAMCDGALRNPDSDEDDDQGGGFFFDADSMVMGESFDRSIDLKEWYVTTIYDIFLLPMRRTSFHSCVSDEVVQLVSS